MAAPTVVRADLAGKPYGRSVRTVDPRQSSPRPEDPDDLVGLALDHQVSADDRSVSPHLAGPETVAEDDDCGAAFPVLLRRERASQDRLESQRPEKPLAGEGRTDQPALSPRVDRDIRDEEPTLTLETTDAVPPIQEVHRVHVDRASVEARARLPDPHQSSRLPVGKGP